MTVFSWVAIITAVIAVILWYTLNWIVDRGPYLVWSNKKVRKEEK